MFNLFRREQTKTTPSFLVLDIGTEVVKVLICEARGNMAVVHGVGRSHQQLGDMQSGAVMDIGGVIQNSKKAIEEACNAANLYPTEVIICIAG